MKKNTKIILNCTTEFKQKLREKARRCNLTLTAYCSLILATAEPKIQEVST